MKPRRWVQDDSWSLMSSSAIDTRVEAASGTLLVIRYCWMLSLQNKAKQTLKTVQNSPKAEKCFSLLFYIKLIQGRKKHHTEVAFLPATHVSWSLDFKFNTLLRTVVHGQDPPYTFLSLSSQQNTFVLGPITSQALLISDKSAFYRSLYYLFFFVIFSILIQDNNVGGIW